MPATDYRSLVRLIDQLYAGAVEPSRWPTFLASVASTFEAQNAFICQLRDRREPIQYIALSERKRDVLPVTQYSSLVAEDPRAQRFSMSLGRPVHCGAGVTRETLRSSRVYREYLKPLDIEHTMVVVFPVGEGGRVRPQGSTPCSVTHDLGLVRGASGRPFNAADCDLLGELSVHLERAFGIQRALQQRNAPAPPPRAAPAPLPIESILKKKLGLAPAQARTTALLMTGQSVKQIAETLGIAENSVRQYLKQTFQRTGTQRQADLVRIAIRACETPDSAA